MPAMSMLSPPEPPQEATDIFSISDQVLADRLQFIEEIGFGNWGSVWLCRPKQTDSLESPSTSQDTKIAVKLVHRSKTSTTAARVRSLWNEMKVVRSLKHEPHPSIIPFYSFIITPSYALITMAFYPRLVPVEVSERHAKEWFRSLLSGVEFLHKRGVVHNDIKPANILLSHENVPVLVDFGFAERYDLNSSKAFLSNLSYGTPEYLSPERARGLPHDTRKSDVWSLGVTFFEILIGRTPFEYSEGEQFSTKEDLEKYWNRTLRGKWVGSWKMSRPVEKLLRKMILPNADLRCTASQAMMDGYWAQSNSAESTVSSHKKASSVSHARSPSLTLDKDISKLLDVVPPWGSRKDKDKENAKADKVKPSSSAKAKENAPITVPHGLGTNGGKAMKPSQLPRHTHTRSSSQPKLQILESRAVNPTKTHRAMPSLLASLSPIKHSPPVASSATALATSARAKENQQTTLSVQHKEKAARTTRKPLGPRGPTPPNSPPSMAERFVQSNGRENGGMPDKGHIANQRSSRALKDVTGVTRNTENISANDAEKSRESANDSVRVRMKEWEKERQRLRDMERLKERSRELEHEQDSYATDEEQSESREVDLDEQLAEREQSREAGEKPKRAMEYTLPKLSFDKGTTSTFSDGLLTAPLSPLMETTEPSISVAADSETSTALESGINIFKHGLKMSIDKTMRLYKSSTLALGRSTPVLSRSASPANEEDQSRTSLSERASWEDDELVRKAKSSLPMVRHAVRNEELAAANQLDRMTIWIKNVEKVVEDARQNFAASTSAGPLPPLPIAPVARRPSWSRVTNRSARAPRKILPANQIFVNEFESAQLDCSTSSANTSSVYPATAHSELNTQNFEDHTLPTIPSEDSASMSPSQACLAFPSTPSRKRRATVVTRSPEQVRSRNSLNLQIDTSPSKRREKSKSQNDLARPITPVAQLEFEIGQLALPPRTPRLSAVVDKSLFIAAPSAYKGENLAPIADVSRDSLTASPLHVEPYPARPVSTGPNITLDTPAKRHIEGVYDRFLMSTTGVKRNGKGYQSDNIGPVLNLPQPTQKRSQKGFLSTRRPMPPPVSSEDLRRASSVDEFGLKVNSSENGVHLRPDQGSTTVSLVRKAFKAMVTAKPASSRLSRAM